MALDNALGTKTPDITGGTVDILAGKKGRTPSVQDMIGVKGDIFRQMQQKNEELARIEPEAAVKQATIKAGVESELAGQEKAQLQNYQQEMAKLNIPEFEPTQETFLGLATMASLIAFVGRGVAGQPGTTSATGAITAMAGMMKGYQQGRKDVFEREKAIFDKNLQTIKSKTEKLKNELELSMKMAATDRRAAEAKATIAIAESNSPVLKAKYEKQGLEEAAKFADGLMKDVQFIESERNKLLKGKGTGEIGLPKDKEAIKQYQARYQTVRNIDDIESLLTNPKYSRYITPATKFTPDVIANLQQNFPELEQKLARIQAIEFEIGGKALTAAEQRILEPIYGWRGLTVNALRQRLAGVKDNFNKQLMLSEETYPAFKQLRPKFDAVYDKTGKVPVEPDTPSNVMPTGEKLTAYAKKYFNGDEQKAREYLISKGYQ